MNHAKIARLPLLACLLVCITIQADANDMPELQLKPCTIELLNGARVKGQLAVQFEMPDHVIVYSPRLATVRSFLKEHVHALTVDGKREQLSPKRALTADDKQLLGRIAWPDAPPNEGRKPAYTAESWQAPRRLMVWAHPGKSGMLTAADNWLIVEAEGRITPDPRSVHSGKLTDTWWHADTDILVPAASRKYHCRRAGKFPCRHVTVEHGAKFEAAALTAVNGNVWIPRGGYARTRFSLRLHGDKHTFFLNDQPALTPDSPGVKTVRGGYIIPQEHPGPGHDGYCVAQYLRVRKGNNASVEFIGTVTSSDDFQLSAGTVIVAEGSQLWPGTRSKQHFRRGTTLRLMSGAEYGKAHNASGSGYGFKYSHGAMDAVINGCIEAGTEDHPLTDSAEFGISFKAPAGFQGLKGRVPGAVIGPDTEIIVHTADPYDARLVFNWHQRHNAWYESRLDGYKQMPELITIAVCGDLLLEHVIFNHLAENGLMLEKPSIVEQWNNVTFGDRCAGDRDDVITKWPDLVRELIVPADWYHPATAGE